MKTLYIEDNTKVFFTSDPHYGHTNIIKFCNRPFNSFQDMNDVLINNWNDVIGEDDLCFILGDFSMWGKQAWNNILDRLMGRKILIMGNHDKDKNVPIERFEIVTDGFLNLRIKDDDKDKDGQRITVCHYPMLSWYQSHRGAWQLFGHMHNNSIMPIEENLENDEVADFMKQQHHYLMHLRNDQYDVGVDGNNFTPISYNQVKKIILKKMAS